MGALATLLSNDLVTRLGMIHEISFIIRHSSIDSYLIIKQQDMTN